jgi:cell division protein FtsW (lipid II flippase)
MSSELHSRSKGTRKRKTGTKVKQLQYLLLTTGGICLLYFISYMLLYTSGNAHDPKAWINSEANYVLSYLISLLYIIYIAAAVRSYVKRDKYKKSFLTFQIFGVFLTLVFILLIVLAFINKTSIERPEFIDEPSE